jgi:hypothetical protein
LFHHLTTRFRPPDPSRQQKLSMNLKESARPDQDCTHHPTRIEPVPPTPPSQASDVCDSLNRPAQTRRTSRATRWETPGGSSLTA